MRLTATTDFYYLIALRQKLSLRSEYHKPTAKLLEKVNMNLEDLSTSLATALHDYLYIISFGEARHAKTQLRAGAYYEEIPTCCRFHAYQTALDYEPSGNESALVEIFSSGDWNHSYGGESWEYIAREAKAYSDGTYSDIAFIDRVIDIAHNGGLAFDKDEVSDFMDLELDWILERRLNRFLAYKFQCDILIDPPPLNIGGLLSSRTRMLCKRYYTITNQEIPDWLYINEHGLRNEWPIYKEIEWGCGVLSNIDYIKYEEQNEFYGKTQTEKEEEKDKHYQRSKLQYTDKINRYKIKLHDGSLSYGKRNSV